MLIIQDVLMLDKKVRDVTEVVGTEETVIREDLTEIMKDINVMEASHHRQV